MFIPSELLEAVSASYQRLPYHLSFNVHAEQPSGIPFLRVRHVVLFCDAYSALIVLASLGEVRMTAIYLADYRGIINVSNKPVTSAP